MASIQLGGVRLFAVDLDTSSSTTYNVSLDTLEDVVNSFLEGDGTVTEPRKEIIQPPQYYVDETNSIVSVLITYRAVT